MTDTDRSAEQPHAHGRARRQFERWHAGSFGPASEEPYRRRTTDWIRLFTAVVVVTLFILHQGDLTSVERDIFTFFNDLPDDLRSLFGLFYRVGALWAARLVVVAAALIARRWRLARDLALAGVVAWFARPPHRRARRIRRTRARPRRRYAPRRRHARVPARAPGGDRRGHLRRVAVPHPPGAPARPVPRLLSMALAAMYLGTGLPDGILTAWFLGWGVGAARPPRRSVRPAGARPAPRSAFALAELGVPAEDVELAPDQTDRRDD